MKTLNALSLCLGVIGALLVYLSLGPASGVFFIWAVFLSAATFFALGADMTAFKNLIICGVTGVVIAWATALIIINVPMAEVLTLPVWAAIVVGSTTALMGLIAHVKLWPAIPATVVGYASTFGYLLQTPDKMSNAVLLGASLSNPLLVITFSMLIGAGFALLSGKLTARLSAPSAAM